MRDSLKFSKMKREYCWKKNQYSINHPYMHVSAIFVAIIIIIIFHCVDYFYFYWILKSPDTLCHMQTHTHMESLNAVNIKRVKYYQVNGRECGSEGDQKRNICICWCSLFVSHSECVFKIWRERRATSSAQLIFVKCSICANQFQNKKKTNCKVWIR